jgi:hypothetical protein
MEGEAELSRLQNDSNKLVFEPFLVSHVSLGEGDDDEIRIDTFGGGNGFAVVVAG